MRFFGSQTTRAFSVVLLWLCYVGTSSVPEYWWLSPCSCALYRVLTFLCGVLLRQHKLSNVWYTFLSVRVCGTEPCDISQCVYWYGFYYNFYKIPHSLFCDKYTPLDGDAAMAKCNQLTSLLFKGLNDERNLRAKRDSCNMQCHFTNDDNTA